MLPVGELRISIPVGFYLDVFWFNALFYSWLGNSFVALILIFVINHFGVDRIRSFFIRIPFVGLIFKKWEKSSIKKSKKVEKWRYLGLALFVSLPLPVTGAWTAVLISLILNLNPIKTFFSIIFGLIISGSIVTLICVKTPKYFELSLFVEKIVLKLESIINFIF
tara:strand:+ start:118 stop:612 length:495 start_codon:yes stop_codon:yes gene_type:complete